MRSTLVPRFPQRNPATISGGPFLLTPIFFRGTIPASSSGRPGDLLALLLAPRVRSSGARCGSAHAILAGFHRAVYQSRLRCPRPLAPRRRRRPHFPGWPLPLLRRPPPHCATAPRSALPHASPRPHRAPPAAPSPLTSLRHQPPLYLPNALPLGRMPARARTLPAIRFSFSRLRISGQSDELCALGYRCATKARAEP